MDARIPIHRVATRAEVGKNAKYSTPSVLIRVNFLSVGTQLGEAEFQVSTDIIIIIRIVHEVHN